MSSGHLCGDLQRLSTGVWIHPPVQPKRARLFLGLTAAPEHAGHLSHQDDAVIFTAAKEKLDASEAKATGGAAAPAVLPYRRPRAGDPTSR